MNANCKHLLTSFPTVHTIKTILGFVQIINFDESKITQYSLPKFHDDYDRVDDHIVQIFH